MQCVNCNKKFNEGEIYRFTNKGGKICTKCFNDTKKTTQGFCKMLSYQNGRHIVNDDEEELILFP